MKATPLKQLQGLIWRAGYEDGSLQAPIYEDAYAALTAWHQAGVPLAVYSSGSIAAQHLFFGYSTQGDCDTCFSIGLILRLVLRLKLLAIGPLPNSWLLLQVKDSFLTDVPAEALAAQQAGWQVAQLDRPDCYPGGNISPTASWPRLAEFSQLEPYFTVA